MMSWEELSHTISILWKGFGLTLYIGLWGIVLSLLVGVALALMRLSHNRLLSSFAFCYSTVFRGTPLLVQLFLLYYGVGMIDWVKQVPWLWWLFSDGTRTAILAIALNSGAKPLGCQPGSALNECVYHWPLGRLYLRIATRL